MENTVKERIKLFLDSSGIKDAHFCKKIGVSSGYISGMRKSIQPDKLESIAINYPSLNIEWLLTGEGEMLKSESDPVNTDTDSGYIRGLLEENRQINRENKQLNNKLAAANDEICRLKKAIGEMGASRKKAITNVVEATTPAKAQ